MADTAIPILNLDTQLSSALAAIYKEHLNLSNHMDFSQLAAIIPQIKAADQIFVMGMGRSGLMMKAAAMRLMHLGFKVNVIGETTTPAIGEGDLLIAGSGSGTTKSIVNAATTAQKVKAGIICFTTDGNSALAKLSDSTVILPAAQKQLANESISAQYAGSLFEQALLIMFDALIQVLWKNDGSTAEELWKRHSNME
ncbi:6-phospho-3-hexuloisomerase [Algoriphagus sp. 4150]|uniref:6-phospho-3-hexuloisomerase n=1 Tax=Algoriphagus sp. 4150 TaxID=2817756 RepID=UPI0028654722|nr:6-phospho-3-hexuloisomerase [Algoriphagus sp. 4150]MDR7130185.1 6-phospho-3-hexuloisomerase [Algoriphagus sp. 4150]